MAERSICVSELMVGGRKSARQQHVRVLSLGYPRSDSPSSHRTGGRLAFAMVKVFVGN